MASVPEPVRIASVPSISKRSSKRQANVFATVFDDSGCRLIRFRQTVGDGGLSARRNRRGGRRGKPDLVFRDRGQRAIFGPPRCGIDQNAFVAAGLKREAQPFDARWGGIERALDGGWSHAKALPEEACAGLALP